MEGAIVLGLAVNHGNNGVVRIIRCDNNQWRARWDALNMDNYGCVSEMLTLHGSAEAVTEQANRLLVITPIFPDVPEEVNGENDRVSCEIESAA